MKNFVGEIRLVGFRFFIIQRYFYGDRFFRKYDALYQVFKERGGEVEEVIESCLVIAYVVFGFIGFLFVELICLLNIGFYRYLLLSLCKLNFIVF